MADLTPPVALAALAAQAIANASHMKIGFIATKIALAGYVIPFMTVYSPALMLQGGTWFDTAYVVGKAVLAIVLWGAAATGWLFGPMAWAERTLRRPPPSCSSSRFRSPTRPGSCWRSPFSPCITGAAGGSPAQAPG